jgi:neutral ceramidase
MTRACFLLAAILPSLGLAEWRAGAAKQNITPKHPVMLSGYGSRTTEATSAKVDIWAKALALSWDDEPPCVILCVDNCGVPASLRAEVLKELAADGLQDAKFNLCSTHTHCAPAIGANLKNLFGFELAGEKLANVQRYTADLKQHLIKVSRAALAAMQPAKLEFVKTKVSFAKNRRLVSPEGKLVNSVNYTGPVDHDVPVLKVSSLDGVVRGVFTSYACHCTTLNWNYFHPDWAGIAQLHVEMAFQKAVCLTAIGCGADQNPFPRHKENDVRIHGFELGKVVRHACASPMKPLRGPLVAASKELQLAYAPYPDTPSLEALAKSKGFQNARHASFLLQRVAAKEAPGSEPYTVQTLSFGPDLAMVFLNGEVVVDYSLRLKRELSNVWVNSYSNNVQGYIPSERILKEGGYEGGGAMVYYFKPGPFAPGLEDKIIGAVKELLPDFAYDP